MSWEVKVDIRQGERGRGNRKGKEEGEKSKGKERDKV